MSSVKKMAGAGSSCAGFLSSVGCKIRCPIHKSSTNVCLVSATDLMEHFAFPGNKDFAADDQGAFHVLFMKGLLCLFIVCETMFTIGKSRTISNANDTQAQQVAPNPCGGRFSTEIREHRLEIQREQRRRRRQQQTEEQKEHHSMNFEC